MDKFVIKTKRSDAGSSGNLNKRPAAAEDAGLLSPKRQKTECEGATRLPDRIISWNCNSIKVRLERKDFKGMVEYMNEVGADALFLQETRLKPEDQVLSEHNMKTAGLQDFKFFWSTHKTKRYSGTACIVRKCCLPKRVTCNYTHLIGKEMQYDGTADSENPDNEARIVILEYDQLFIMNTYTPMASWYDGGRGKRDTWDARFRSLVNALQAQKPVVIIGDLNVCHQPSDVSHPTFFAQARKPGNVGGERQSQPGQPGYTLLERERFGQLLEECKLIDTFRRLHPDLPRLTWGFSSNYEVGIYRGKYMGLDYALVSQSIWDASCVVKSEVCGASHCFGSDHCCILAEFDWTKLQQTPTAAVEGMAVSTETAEEVRITADGNGAVVATVSTSSTVVAVAEPVDDGYETP